MPRKRSKPIIFKEIPCEDLDAQGYVSQLNYLGEPERLKGSIYFHKLLCPCGKPRYYKAQDKKQVERAGRCKPCLRNIRLQRRKSNTKSKIIREVLEESL